MLDLVFEQILKDPTPLSADFLRSAYVCATELGNDVLLASLATRPDLPADVDKDIAVSAKWSVRAAWISRPGRTTEEVELALRKETRSNVLSAVAATEGLPDHIAERLSRDKNKSVAFALLNNITVNKEYRCRALLALAARYESLTHAQKADVRAVALDQSLLSCEEVASCATGALLGYVLQRAEHLTEETQLRLVHELLEVGFSRAAGLNSWNKTYACDHAYTAAISILRCSPSDICIDAVKKACADQQVTSKRKEYESALAAVEGGAAANTKRLLDAAEATSADDLSVLIEHATIKSDTRLAQTLLRNDKISPSDIARLAAVCSWEAGLEAAMLHNDPEVAAHILGTRSVGAQCLHKTLVFFGEPVVVRLSSDWRVGQALCDDENLSHLLDVFVAGMPLSRLVRHHSNMNGRLIESFVRQLSSIPPEGFRIAAALQKDWEGSLTDLLQAVEAVSQ